MLKDDILLNIARPTHNPSPSTNPKLTSAQNKHNKYSIAARKERANKKKEHF